jgi:hypothetical protein
VAYRTAATLVAADLYRDDLDGVITRPRRAPPLARTAPYTVAYRLASVLVAGDFFRDEPDGLIDERRRFFRGSAAPRAFSQARRISQDIASFYDDPFANVGRTRTPAFTPVPTPTPTPTTVNPYRVGVPYWPTRVVVAEYPPREQQVRVAAPRDTGDRVALVPARNSPVRVAVVNPKPGFVSPSDTPED